MPLLVRRPSVALLALCMGLQAQTLSAPGRVSGTVRDSTGQALAGAAVVLVNEASTASTTKPSAVDTDSRGTFVFAGIAAGHYRVKASLPPSNQGATVSVVVDASETQVSLTLHPAGDGASQDMLSLEQGASGNGAPPDFSVAGVEGTIAPSGYAAGVAERQASQLTSAAVAIGNAPLPAVVFSEGVLSCEQEPALRRQLAAKPADAEANHRLGLFYLQRGNATQALLFLVKSDAAGQHDRHNTLDLALTYRLQGRFADALFPLGRLIEVDSQDAEAHASLAGTLASLGRSSEAAAEFQTAAALDRSEANLFACGLGLVRLGDAKAADLLFAKALQAQPSSPRLWVGLGLAQSLEQKQTEAIRSFLRAVALHPEGVEAYPFLALLSGANDASDQEIERVMQEYLGRHPESASAHYNAALARIGRKNSRSSPADREAIEALLRAAIASSPDLASAHFQLGLLYADSGKDLAAIAELKIAVRLRPSDSEAHYRLAQAYRRQGDAGAASHELGQFEALRRRTSDPGRFLEGDPAVTSLENLTGSKAFLTRPDCARTH